jgi:hypothetical protein
VSCQPLEGAMYAFPRITFPDKFLAAAKAADKKPDVMYALAVLQRTGIVMVPGRKCMDFANATFAACDECESSVSLLHCRVRLWTGRGHLALSNNLSSAGR